MRRHEPANCVGLPSERSVRKPYYGVSAETRHNPKSPLTTDRRHIKITDRRTAIGYTHALEDLSDRHFPNAKKIVLMQDNLNTHKPASLYEAFPPDKARRLVERFEWHYTPNHGSWLDMAEFELAVLASKCLDRRIPISKSSSTMRMGG